MAENGYPDLEKHNNHMAHCLTEELYKRMITKETKSGFTIDNAIQIGIDNPGNPYDMLVGCVAGDEESYEVFHELFDQVIEARHNGYKKTDQHKTNLDPAQITSSSWGKDVVLSCRVRSSRNIKGFCLPPHCTRAERRKVEELLKNACSKLSGECKGKYKRVNELQAEYQQLMDGQTKNFPTPTNLSPCMSRDWPDGRGVFTNDKKDFVVKVNIKDHIRVIALEKTGNLKQVFSNWSEGMAQLENCLKEENEEFMKSSHLGYINTCPSNLGTGLKASVRMQIPKMMKHYRFEEVLRRLRLKKQASTSEGQVLNSACDISNSDGLGVSEMDIIQTVIDGVTFLINCEKKLEKEESIENDINRIQQK